MNNRIEYYRRKLIALRQELRAAQCPVAKELVELEIAQTQLSIVSLQYAALALDGRKGARKPRGVVGRGQPLSGAGSGSPTRQKPGKGAR